MFALGRLLMMPLLLHGDLVLSVCRLVNMYSKWLDEDNEEIDVSTEELTRLKDQFKEMIDKTKDHSSAIQGKAETLNDKEKRLKVCDGVCES